MIAQATKALLTLLALAIIGYSAFVIFLPLAGPSPFVTFNGKQQGVADWVIFYGAGVIGASADHNRIYDPQVQMDWCNKLIAPEHMGSPFYIQYPPWFFTIMSPLSVMNIKQAYVFWAVLWTVVSAAAMWLDLKTGAIRSNIDRILFISMVFACAPYVVGVRLGQTSLYFFTCVCFIWWAWRTGRDRLCGALIAFSSIKLQYVPFLLIAPIAARRYKVLLSAAVVELLIVIVTVINVGFDNFLKYPSFLAYVESHGLTGVSPASMVNLNGIVYHWLPHTACVAVVAAGFVAAIAYLSFMWWRVGRSGTTGGDAWPIAATLALALVFSPHTHYHDCVNLAVAAAFTLKSVSLMANARERSLSYQIWALIITGYPFITWLCYINRVEDQVPILGFVNMALAAAAICQCEKGLRESKTEAKA